MSTHTLFFKKVSGSLPCPLSCSGDSCAESLKDSVICPLERTEAQWKIEVEGTWEQWEDGGKRQKRLQADLDSYQLGCFRIHTNLEVSQPGAKSAGCTTTEIYSWWHPTPEASLPARDRGTGGTREQKVEVRARDGWPASCCSSLRTQGRRLASSVPSDRAYLAQTISTQGPGCIPGGHLFFTGEAKGPA